MRPQLVPAPDDDRVATAVDEAIARAGIELQPLPAAYASAWADAGRREAVEREPQAPSPRSTRGATRA